MYINLSPIRLTTHRSFTISIVRDTLNFIRDGHTVIQAKVDYPSNAAFLAGEALPVEQFVSLSSSTTFSMD
jgi:hypothetical protein